MLQNLDDHLKKYIVDSETRPYTYRDHAVWRFILRQLKSYLKKNAHPFYVEGLDKTGISVEEIPSISAISEKLKEFGWTARPVSGFIPPAVFMEMQAAHILPIARDMRSLDQLQYTPAPDIVHEAAGHAPMLAHPEYAQYLKNYAQVAKMAILSKQDLEIYAAIRKLSDLKSDSHADPQLIEQTQNELDHLSQNISHLSEATLLSRMNWWTAEYGLIGSLDDPKIFGAGLLSSVSEAKWCLSPQVKKIPLTLDCINYSYDITEPQPQLFVTPHFSHLSTVLDELSQTMAYKTGGIQGLEKARLAETVCSLELNSGLQISGIISDFKTKKPDEIIFVKLTGPTQLSFMNQEIQGHSKKYHSSGYSTPLGPLIQFPNKSTCAFSIEDWKQLGLNFKPAQTVELNWTSGFKLKGQFKSKIEKNGKILVLTFENAHLTYLGENYFLPEWGDFDLALGSNVKSVFGGPADRLAYGEIDEFALSRIPTPEYSTYDQNCFEMYKKIRSLRYEKLDPSDLNSLFISAKSKMQEEWLIFIELLELAKSIHQNSLETDLLQHLRIFPYPENVKNSIAEGIQLSDRLKI
jgi:phenylalanine-4-hydroxylase